MFSAFNKQWADAQASIDDLLEVELPKEPAKPERVNTTISLTTD